MYYEVEMRLNADVVAQAYTDAAAASQQQSQPYGDNLLTFRPPKDMSLKQWLRWLRERQGTLDSASAHQ